MLEVHHDAAAHRFTTEVDGERAELDYSLSAGVMTITHTGVPQPIEGRGVASELMREALSVAKGNGWQVVPACSYAAAYIARHPDAAPGNRSNQQQRNQHQSDLLDEALEESFPASDPPSVGQST